MPRVRVYMDIPSDNPNIVRSVVQRRLRELSEDLGERVMMNGGKFDLGSEKYRVADAGGSAYFRVYE